MVRNLIIVARAQLTVSVFIVTEEPSSCSFVQQWCPYVTGVSSSECAPNVISITDGHFLVRQNSSAITSDSRTPTVLQQFVECDTTDLGCNGCLVDCASLLMCQLHGGNLHDGVTGHMVSPKTALTRWLKPGSIATETICTRMCTQLNGTTPSCESEIPLWLDSHFVLLEIGRKFVLARFW